MGIGLYQAYRQAQAAGFVISVSSNQPGSVAFCLR